MNSRLQFFARLPFAMLLGLASAVVAFAQPIKPAPRIGYAYPAGGRQGTTFRVNVGGQNLADCAGVVFSEAEGLSAKIIEYNRPLNGKEFAELRDQQKALAEKKAAAKDKWSPEDEAAMAEVRKKLINRPNRQGSPAIAETVTLEVTVAADAKPGDREIRLRTPNGLSNPVLFNVGQLPEFSLPDSRMARAEAKFGRGEQVVRPRTETAITLPATLNGQVLPGEVDRYRFHAVKGQKLVAQVRARGLIPYLADAVPGWFQAALTLYDAKGRELAFDGSYEFNPDPVLLYQIQQDGDYVIEIRDSIYRGREDFVYRISLGELPFIVSINPLGGPCGSDAAISLSGWNLGADKVTVSGVGRKPGTVEVAVGRGGLLSNTVLFAFGDEPELPEVEPNNSHAQAMPVSLPVVVNGVISKPGDVDVVRFEGKAGQVIEAETFARRLNSPLDSTLRITDAQGNQLAFNDDHEDKGSGLTTHHADSRVSLTLPADGRYFVEVADAQHKGGPASAYRLRIGAPRPDFELRTVPSSVTARVGDSVPITLYALRRGGFTGEIRIAPNERESGLLLSGAVIPAGEDRVRLTLQAQTTPREEPYDISLEGHAMIGGVEVVHRAVPAEDMMQAFAYRHLVVSNAFKLDVLPRPGRMPVLGWKNDKALVLKPGAKTEHSFEMRAGPLKRDLPLQFALSEAPEGISLLESPQGAAGETLVFTCDSAKVKAGSRGNLIIEVFFVRTKESGKGKAKETQRVLIGHLPALPYEIRTD